jgi:hypothetical protein
VSFVVSPAESANRPRRIGDLRRRQPADTTLRNLLGLLDAKLDLCATLPVYEWEAGREGHARSAETFHTLAELERRSCNRVIEELRHYLDDVPLGKEDRA